MNYINDLLHILISPANGFVFSRIVLDVAMFLPLILVVYHHLTRFHMIQKRIKVLDGIAGFHVITSEFNNPHWFHGHRGMYTHDHNGLIKMTRRTSDFPGLFNFHVAPWLSSLHLTHPETIAPVVASSAPKCDMFYGFLKPWIGNGLLRSNGKYWHHHRRLITPAFHFSILKSYIPTINECAKEMLDKFDSTKGKPVEVFEPVGLLTLDTMLRCAMSTTTNCQATEHRHPYVEAIHVLSDIVTIRSRTPILFFNWIFNLLPIGRRFNKALTVAHSFTGKIIANRRKELMESPSDQSGHKEELNYRGEKLRNFLDTLLTAEDEDGVKLTDEEIREEVDTFLVEGHDTTSSGISWALYNLAKYPKEQSKCGREVKQVVGGKEYVEWADLPKLEYLTMCIKESLRLYPPVPVVMRDLDRSLPIKSRHNVSGADVPKATPIVLQIMGLQRNRHLWNCIGQNFAMNEMKVVLAQTLRRFKLSIDPSTPEPQMSFEIVLRTKEGIRIKFEEL